jgi:flagellar basal body-associated protein FliL
MDEESEWSTLVLIIGGIIVVLLILAAGGYFFLFSTLEPATPPLTAPLPATPGGAAAPAPKLLDKRQETTEPTPIPQSQPPQPPK